MGTCGFTATAGVLDILDILQYIDHDNSSSNSHLIQSKANRKISKNYSNILMEQQLLSLIYSYRLAFFLLFLSYTQKIHLLLFCCYLFYNYLHHYFH